MNKSTILELIANGENSGVEFKLDDIRPEHLAKEVVALANFKGGRILLGVADDKSVVGITRENLGEWVADTVFARYIHPMILPYYEEVIMDGGKIVAVVTVGQGISKPYVLRANDRETAYVRIGSISRPATREQLLMLGSASGMIHSETMPVHRSSFESLDLARLDNYLRDIINDPEVPKNRAEWIERLQRLALMVDGPTAEPVCTIAGLILFGIRPRQFLKQAGLRLMFFDAKDKIYQAMMDKILDAPLVGRFQANKAGKVLIDAGLIEKSLESMEPFITREANMIDENFRREKTWLYPFEAIRELLINSFAHRDWTRFVDVEIAGYQDRLEIISPGTLPNSMTIEKVLAGQRSARNPIVVEVLRDYGYVDARGMGIRTKVVPLITQHSGQAPEFLATDDFFKTTLRSAIVPETVPETVPDTVHEAAPLSLKGSAYGENTLGDSSIKPIQGQLLSLLSLNPRLSYDELSAIVGRTRKTVQRHLQILKSKGFIRRMGAARGGHWKVLKKLLADYAD